jgi:hypothetical protein
VLRVETAADDGTFPTRLIWPASSVSRLLAVAIGHTVGQYRAIDFDAERVNGVDVEPQTVRSSTEPGAADGPRDRARTRLR